MKKLLLLGVFALSMGVTLFVSSPTAEAAINSGDPSVKNCQKEMAGLIPPTLGEPGIFYALRGCMYDRQYYFEYDRYSRELTLMKCPATLFFCGQKMSCEFPNTLGCSSSPQWYWHGSN